MFQSPRALTLCLSVWSWSCISILAPSFGAQADYLASGTNFYQQGNFLKANADFNSAICQSPRNAQAHYLLANTLVKLGHASEAANEYQTALVLAKDAQLQSYCRTALFQLIAAAPMSPTPLPGAQTAAVQGANSYAPSLGGVLTAPASLPQKELSRQRASKSIAEQADMTNSNLYQTGNAQAQDWQRTGNLLATQERTKASNTARSMANTKNSQQGIVYSQDQINSVIQQGDAAAQEQITQARERSQKAMDSAQARIRENQAAAQNLQDLLNAPQPKTGVRIKAEGTNFYVRNFEADPVAAEKAQVAKARSLQVFLPLQATPKSLSVAPGTKSGGRPNSKSDENWQVGKSSGAHTDVYGKLLN